MEKHIYFVRHGESEENVDHVYRGRDAALTDAGKEQARVVAERIGRIGVDVLITSPFTRAADTAAVIGKHIGHTPEQNELFGEWLEPSHVMGLHRDHPERQAMFNAIHTATDPHYRHKDEETFPELLERARFAIQVLAEHPAKRICIVTHGGFLKMMVGAMIFHEAFSKEMFVHMIFNMPTTNTGVTYVKNVKEERGWQLVTWNDQSHLG
ncbi:phosphoglycerate mutase family protein [Patescibacteria group bacterium]|nr:phosphoglycerate mutase family protein [Patescibacteria group bacterium]